MSSRCDHMRVPAYCDLLQSTYFRAYPIRCPALSLYNCCVIHVSTASNPNWNRKSLDEMPESPMNPRTIIDPAFKTSFVACYCARPELSQSHPASSSSFLATEQCTPPNAPRTAWCRVAHRHPTISSLRDNSEADNDGGSVLPARRSRAFLLLC